MSEQSAEQTTVAEKTEKQLKKEQKAKEKQEKKRLKHEKQRRLLFPVNKRGRHINHAMNFYRVLTYPIHRFFYPFRRFGAKKVADGPFIFVGNHYCIWDIFYPAHTTWEAVHFMSKQSVLEAPVLGYLARRMGVIGAMRDGSDIRTVMEALKVLKHGDKLSMFPEGTRNKKSEEEFLPFHGGAAMLSIKTKTPIVPFVICSRPRLFRMTHIVYGEPMEFTEYYDRKLTSADYDEADEKLKRRLYELRDEHRKMLAEKKARKRKKKSGK